MKRLFLVSVIILVLSAFVFGGCAKPGPAPAPPAPSPAPAPAPAPAPTPKPAPPPAPAKAEWELKYEHMSSPTGDEHLHGHVPFAKAIEEATKGRVKVTIFPDSPLGSPMEMYARLKSRMNDMAWCFIGFYPGVFPMTEVVTFPFIGATDSLKSSEALWKLYQKYPDAFAKEYGDAKVLFIMGGELPILCSKKPVNTMADLKGLKIRAPGGSPTEILKAMGASPASMYGGDVYTAIEKGVIEAAIIDGWNGVDNWKWWEVTNYFLEVPMYTAAFWTLMNINTWKALPPDVQQQIMSVGGHDGMVKFVKSSFYEPNKALREKVKAMPGKKITSLAPDELAKWATVGAEVRAKLVANLEAKGLPGKAALDDVMSYLK